LRQRIWSRFASNRPSKSDSPKPVETAEGLKQWIRTKVQSLLLPDPQVNWRWTAIRTGVKVILEEGIRNILVTAPPFSSFHIGIALKKRFPHIRLISEFRDEWLGYYIHSDPNATAAKHRAAVALEREVVAYSDYIVTVTPAWVDTIRNRYPEQPASKFICVPNGFDPDSFTHFTSRPHGLNRMLVAYIGTVYSNPVYSPRPYLEALNSLPEPIRSQVETHFIGRVVDEEIPGIDGCASPTKRLGFLPQAATFRHLEQADCALLIVNSPTAHSGKLFEYLASGKPILAIAPRSSELARMIQETRGGWLADPAEPNAVSHMLEQAFSAIREGRSDLLPRPDWEKVRSYERPRLVATLAEAARMRHPL
jgi:glycosyltransferase involved in cell wall biosynthesis